MAIVLTINGTNYEFPESNENPNWAQDITAWATALSSVANRVLTVNSEIGVGSQYINNLASTTVITDLLFPNTIQAANISYVVDRSSVSTPAGIFETGIIQLIYDVNGSAGNKWFLYQTKYGDAGIAFTVSDAGQISYTTTDITSNGYAGKIRYSVNTFKSSNLPIY
jgi:hypothetical protein